MTTAVVFDLISELVDTFATALPTVNVYDGQGGTDDPGNFLMVGVGDPNSDEPATSASGSLTWAGLGHRSSKEGSESAPARITCVALAWNGSTGNDAQKAAREAVRDISSAVEVALRTDPNLGGRVPGLNWVRYAGDWSLDQLSASDGTAAIFQFDITYIASLTI